MDPYAGWQHTTNKIGGHVACPWEAMNARSLACYIVSFSKSGIGNRARQQAEAEIIYNRPVKQRWPTLLVKNRATEIKTYIISSAFSNNRLYNHNISISHVQHPHYNWNIKRYTHCESPRIVPLATPPWLTQISSPVTGSTAMTLLYDAQNTRISRPIFNSH